MCRNIVIYLTVAASLSGCAFQGTVVEKRSRPIPFPCSLGLDAMYNFQLRDTTGQVHSQMVTADVFGSYREGDYFNDLQSPPAHDDKELEGFRLAPPELREGPYQPVRVMQMRAPQRAANVALHTYDRVDNEIKIPRWQTVRSVPMHAPERVVAKIVLHPQDQVQNGVRIPRWQTVRIVQVHSPGTAATKVAIAAPDHAGDAVKILRWQTVRILQNPAEKTAAKIANPAQRHARSAGKTAASPNRIKQPAKIAGHKKKRAKVASKEHRKTVASVN